MDSPRSLRTRAIMAVALMVGFYVFALGIAGTLLFVPYAEVRYLHRVDGRILVFCLVGGLSILWSILPRADKFDPPGPRLTPSTAPHLFTMINDVAAKTSQARPEDVYLLNQVNAFVTHRGGFMGFGSKRVMGIGLPLIKGLTPAELRSVIAHEFGHYVSGDVALGPWIYKTRGAIGRTLTTLGDSILTKAFAWYARMFMRMTMQISREQEFVADATAARVAGTESTINALKRVEVIAPAYSSYLQNEVLPVLRAGFMPPITEGFDQYINTPEMMKVFEEHAGNAEHETGEYDSHPPMPERIKALQQGRPLPSDVKSDALSMLLKEPERHSRALIEHNIGKDEMTKLKTIGWTEVGAKVYAQLWADVVKKHAKSLAVISADQLPSDKKWFERQGQQLTTDIPEAPAEYRTGYAVHVFNCAIGVILLRQGWMIETMPGKPILLVKDGTRVNLGETLHKLAMARMSIDEWKALCGSMGIDGVKLA